jgi:hypothetical protein
MIDLSQEDLEEKLHNKISSLVFNGWRIVDKNEKRLECILERGGDFKHWPHVLISMFTGGLWGFVWRWQYKKKGIPRRLRITFDKSGNCNEELKTAKLHNL